MKIYQVKDWNEHFENSKSRERKACSFVCVPNKQSGMSFCRIMALEDGAMIYGIWCLILGACSQQKERHGWLTSDGYKTGTPWVVDDLALKFRRPKSEIERALNVLISDEIGWILQVQCPSSTRVLPADCPPAALERKKEEKEMNSDSKESETTSNHQEFIKCWTDAFKSKHGFPYQFSAGKDGAAVKRLLAGGISVSDALGVAIASWNLGPKDDFHRKHSIQISSFVSNLNVLRELTKGKAMDKPRPSSADIDRAQGVNV